MGRILFFAVLALAVYLGYRWWLAQRKAAARRAQEQTGAVECMVRCEVCGLNLPQSEALPGDSRPAEGAAPRWYCGEAHRQQHRS
jgi:hypothetical protein